MWETQVDVLDDGRVHHVALLRDGAGVSYADVVQYWRTDEPFRAFFAALLADVRFKAYFWETPPVTQGTAVRMFEFVLVNSPESLLLWHPSQGRLLAISPPSQAVVTFATLGGDALLVAPAPQGPPAAYAHLAAFARQAPMEQQHALWRAVGAAAAQRLSSAPLWLSTSGLGVAWLHVRLDERPKYYTYAPYRSQPGLTSSRIS
jgi:hypothetical protein